jgi:E3 ubiquitin-protein ligase HUWE1
MDNLLALLLSNPVNAGVEHPSVPRWLAAHLLVTEALLTLGDQPRSITLPKQDEPIVPEAVTVGPCYPEARTIVFDFCLRLLAIPSLPSDELLSVLRLFVLLTRHHQMACQFVKRNGVTLLFNRLKSSAVAGSQSYIAIILRHIVEDAAVLRHIMQQAIKRYFSQPRTHVVEVGTYVRNCSAMALRDSQVFLGITQSLCNLAHPFSTTPHLSLKGEAVATDEAFQKPEASRAADMDVDASKSNTTDIIEPHESPQSESLESLVHFLVNDLMKTSKAIVEFVAEAPHSESRKSIDTVVISHPNSGPDVQSTEGQVDPTDSSAPDSYNYACFLMQCLTELLFSYDSCKAAFLSFSPKKRHQTPGKEAANKHRTAALHFLLSDLISFNTINPQPNPVARNRIVICSWAMSVIVALCVDSSSAHEPKDISADLISVRKFVLEAISRSIKDLSLSENVDRRYGRLLALADLCHRLLTVRINTTSRKQADDTPTHMAKVMLEKNFVSTLTNALVEVDLNFPNVRGLVASILRPIEHL